MVRIHGTSLYYRTLSHLRGNAYQNKRPVGGAKGTTAEELAEALALVWLGTSGSCLKSQLTVSPATKEYIKVAESVMVSALKIQQKFLKKHTIMDHWNQITKHA